MGAGDGWTVKQYQYDANGQEAGPSSRRESLNRRLLRPKVLEESMVVARVDAGAE